MIAALRGLPPNQQRQLIKLLDTRADLDDVTDDEVSRELVTVLRRALDVPADADLPEYIRRRLVEVAVRQFEIADNLDVATDMEVAHSLVDFVLDAAQRLGQDDERREEFETFLRTKDRAERTRWLVQSQRFAAVIQDETFDRQVARERAEHLLSEQSAHREVAQAILGDLSSIAVKGRTETKPKRSRLASAAALGGADGAALAPGLAVTASAVAGGLYMAGRARHELIKADDVGSTKGRAQRARRSKLVQNVVALCAFLVANAPDEP